MRSFQLGCLACVLSFFALPFLSVARPGCSFPARTPPKDECTAESNIDYQPFNSRILQNYRIVRVLLPAGYKDKANRAKHYPVLYLNDGQNLFDVCTSLFGPQEWQVDETVNRLIARGEIPPLIVVGIDNAGRGERPAEYLPYPDLSLNPPMSKVRADKYLQFLFREVMPFINKRYRTLTGPENTGIGGSSYGAVSALHTVLKNPEVFGRLLLESPSLYISAEALLTDSKRARSWPRKIYLGIGTNEARRDDWSREAVAELEEFARILRAAGLDHDRLLVYIEEGATHEENAWARRLPHALKFLYVDEPSSTPSAPP